MSSQETFTNTLTDLKAYCKKSIEDLQPILTQTNQAAYNLTQPNSESLGSAATQKITEAATLQKKIDLFHIALSYSEQILHNLDSSNDPTKSIPGAFETLLLVLGKFEEGDFLSQVQKAIQSLYGDETLDNLKKYAHINVEMLEKGFEAKFSPVFIREYAYILQKIYNPQPKEQAVQPIQPSQNVAEKQGSTNTSPIKGNKDASNDQEDQKGPVEAVETVKSEEVTIVNSCTSIEKENKENVVQDVKASNSAEEVKVNSEETNKQENEKPAPNWDHLKIINIKGLNLDKVKQYQETQAKLLASNKKFTDYDFPPALSSITSDLSTFADASKIIWKRLPELFEGKELTLCGSNIGPEDIYQGKLKDCYLLSALSVLSEQRHYIDRLFESKEITPTGCYSVWLCDSGEWKNIIVDDYIPCIYKNRQLKPYFAHLTRNDIWVCLLEKAFAKLHGNYTCIADGYQVEAYHALTGAPVRNYKQKENRTQSIEQFWNFISKNLEKKHVVTSSCRADEPILNHEGMGLVSTHAYAIMDAKEVKMPDGTVERVVKIKNPWGYRDWKGKWADNSLCWTEEMKEMLGYKPKDDDGVFWMGIEDMDKHFYQSYTCKVHSDFSFYFLKMGEKRKQNQFVAKLRMNTQGYVYLGVQQRVKRQFPKDSGYDYSYVRMYIARLNNGKIVSVWQGNHDWGQSVIIEQNLTKGLYLVYIEVDWVQDIYNKINLTAYSNQEVQLTEEPLEKYNMNEMYCDILKTHALNKKDHRFQLVQYSVEGNQVEIWKYEVRKFGLGVVLYVNKEKDLELNVSLKMKCKNMYLEIPKEESLEDICVPAGGEKLVVYRADKVLKVYKDYAFDYDEDYNIRRICKEDELKVEDEKKGECAV